MEIFLYMRRKKYVVRSKERATLWALQADRTVVVLKAVKGNASVLLDQVTYHAKIQTALEERASE